MFIGNGRLAVEFLTEDRTGVGGGIKPGVGTEVLGETMGVEKGLPENVTGPDTIR